jgi:hypothetical protein
MTQGNRTGKFNLGQNNGTAVCVECGRRRQKGNGEQADGAFHCVDCWTKAGDQNMVADGQMSCREFVARYGEHSEYCDCPTCAEPGCAYVGQEIGRDSKCVEHTNDRSQ